MSENINQDDAGQLPALLGTPSSLAVGIARAEIDQQITTARAYPRSVKQVLDRIYTLATLDEQSAEESMYALPRGQGADAKAITGPSIRFAEIVKQAYGNCRAAARVVHVDRDEKYVEAEGVFHDLETNVATTARVRRRISTSKGYLFSDDMIIVTGNAACSIALRNAIMGGVPKPLWRKAFEAVQQVIKGDATTLSAKRQEAVKAFANFGVKPEQVFAAIGVAGGEDITVEHIPILRGMFSALKNSEATVEELFSNAGTQPGSQPPPLDTGAKPSAAEAAASVEKKRNARKSAAKAQPEGAEGAPAAGADLADKLGADSQTAAQAAAEALGGDDLPDDLKGDAPAVDEEQEPEPEVEAEEEGDEDAEALPPEMKTFIDAVESVDTFQAVKLAMATFFGTALFKGMDAAQQNHVRYQTWMTLVDRKAAAGAPGEYPDLAPFTDLPDHATDVSAFRLWIETVNDADAITGTLAVLEQQPGFAGKDDAFKTGIRNAAAARINRG